MKLTKRQLRIIIENYLVEQDSDNSDPESEELIDDEPEAEETPVEEPVDSEVSDETGAEETGDETPSEDTPPDDDPLADDGDGASAEQTESLPDKTNPFEIIIDDIKHTIQFVKDKAANLLKLKIDGVEVKNPKPQDFVTMAGLGMQGKLSDDDATALETIVKKTDRQFAKFENFDDLAKIIQDKMNAERQGFSVADIRDTIRKKNR